VRWVLLGFSIVVYFTMGLVLTARAVGGWSRLTQVAHTDATPTKYLLASMAMSVLTAVAINPLDERSFDASDWIGTAFVVAATVWMARRLQSRQP
jgi:hypothetical protein